MFTKLNPNEEFKPYFEIDLVVRDGLGNPTKQRRQHRSDNGYDIWEFWSKYQGAKKRKKKKTEGETRK